ncbi:hypothetical protein PEDI_42720 [Persicobacter diffluens]|uniref:Uncharacterized protein n=1 Tax=Persicobacter diffluens TaxID=981 RepID=A0AAN4W387_9BACT|nr:hypothetical protein PEDI_42720 [Persicobacter diffluens]
MNEVKVAYLNLGYKKLSEQNRKELIVIQLWLISKSRGEFLEQTICFCLNFLARL